MVTSYNFVTVGSILRCFPSLLISTHRTEHYLRIKGMPSRHPNGCISLDLRTDRFWTTEWWWRFRQLLSCGKAISCGTYNTRTKPAAKRWIRNSCARCQTTSGASGRTIGPCSRDRSASGRDSTRSGARATSLLTQHRHRRNHQLRPVIATALVGPDAMV